VRCCTHLVDPCNPRNPRSKWIGGPTLTPLVYRTTNALQYPWLEVYLVNPVTSARYRTAFTPSGASDDLPDARVLLELIRDHASRLRRLEPQDEQTQHLLALVQTRRNLVDRRTQLLLQLTSLLKSYYPQALQLVGPFRGHIFIIDI
jgi:hypothetical protein